VPLFIWQAAVALHWDSVALGEHGEGWQEAPSIDSAHRHPAAIQSDCFVKSHSRMSHLFAVVFHTHWLSSEQAVALV